MKAATEKGNLIFAKSTKVTRSPVADPESGLRMAGRANYPIFVKSKGDVRNPCNMQSTAASAVGTPETANGGEDPMGTPKRARSSPGESNTRKASRLAHEKSTTSEGSCESSDEDEPLTTERLGNPEGGPRRDPTMGELKSLLKSAGQLAEYVLEMSRIVAAKAKLNKDVREATGIARAMAHKLSAELRDFDADKLAIPEQTEEQRRIAEREAKAEEAHRRANQIRDILGGSTVPDPGRLLQEEWPKAAYVRTAFKRGSLATSESATRALVADEDTEAPLLKALANQFPGVKGACEASGLTVLKATYSESRPGQESRTETKTLLIKPMSDASESGDTLEAAGEILRALEGVSTMDIEVPEKALETWRKALEVASSGRDLHITLCVRKRHRPKSEQPPRNPRGGEITVAVNGRSYVDVLKSINESLQSEDIEIADVSRTRAGAARIRVGGPAENASRIGEILGRAIPGAAVDASGRKKWLRSTKLAPGVTEEAVKAALTTVLGRTTRAMVTSIRPAYPDKVRVNILVPISEAEEIKRKPPFRMGLLKGAFADPPKRCRRCNEVGHLAAQCRGPDRSKQCFNCHQEGHMARDCTIPAERRRHAATTSPKGPAVQLQPQ